MIHETSCACGPCEYRLGVMHGKEEISDAVESVLNSWPDYSDRVNHSDYARAVEQCRDAVKKALS